jgi:hypothetical protein
MFIIYCDVCEKELFGNLQDFNAEYQSTGKIVCAECKDKSKLLLNTLILKKGDITETISKLDIDNKASIIQKSEELESIGDLKNVE